MKVLLNKWIIITVLSILVIISFIYFYKVVMNLPQLPQELKDIALSYPTEIYSDNGELITVLSARQSVNLSQISRHFLNAIVATEDKNFYSHHGLDKMGIFRMFFLNMRRGRIVGGGSTITQQLAKNLFFSFEQTWKRKVREAFIALQMERRYTKKEILETYCNQINFGANAYGIERAAQTYLGKHAEDLTLAEAAFLANLPRWPSYYNPYQNFDIAKQRQKVVLSRMLDCNFITREEMDEALQDSISLKRLNLLYGKANYFINQVKNQVEQEFSKDVLYYGGLKIYTTLDTRLQSLGQETISSGLSKLDDKMGFENYELAPLKAKREYIQAALVAIDPNNGKVKAMVGGRDFTISPYNRAIENNRQPGSSFKPFTYLAAIDKGYVNPASILLDSAVTFKFYNQTWSPPNWDKKYFGNITLKTALTHSKNVIAAKLIDMVKPETVVEYAHKMGIQSKLEPVLSLSLGTSTVSPLEMATAYIAFASGGIAREAQMIKIITNSENKTLRDYHSDGNRVVDPQSVYLVVDMLKNVVKEGTARRARYLGFDRPCAGKTGTTDDTKDLWFVGFTPQLVTAVWIGFDEPKPILNKRKASMSSGEAVQLWTNFMKQALQNEPYRDFTIPQGITFEFVDPKTGEIVPETFPDAQQVAIKAGTNLSVKEEFSSGDMF